MARGGQRHCVKRGGTEGEKVGKYLSAGVHVCLYHCVGVRLLDGDSFHRFYGPQFSHMFDFLADMGGWGGVEDIQCYVLWSGCCVFSFFFFFFFSATDHCPLN